MKTSNSFISKLSRKTKKYSHMLERETELREIPLSKYVMVCNAGLVSGIQQEQIGEIFSNYSLKKIIMIPRKSYCFVEFNDENKAKAAIIEIHGKLFVPEISGPLYLLCINKMPENCLVTLNRKPDGLLILNDFINDEEEEFLLQFALNELNNSGNNLKNRQVKHFGYEFNYKTNNINKINSDCKQIPEELDFIIRRLKNSEDKLSEWIPNQLTINMYLPGQGIPSHIDTHSAFDNIILSLSVGSNIVMEFKNGKNNQFSTLLRRKSLLIMCDDSRYIWSHGITPRKFDIIESTSGLTTQKRNMRISFTFRHVQEISFCNCQFNYVCDSKNNLEYKCDLNIDNRLASELERIHVHQVYDEIADHFNETRHKPWPNVEEFIKCLEVGSIFVDIGCGNGKYFRLNDSVFQVGCDRNQKLNQECYIKGYETLICDCLRLPFRSESVDYCICIAVIHHLSTNDRRQQAIKEITRIMRPGGLALIYVWAKNQKQNDTLSSYLKQKNQNIKTDDIAHHSVKLFTNENPNQNKTENVKEICLPVHVNRTQFLHEDLFVPWKMKAENNKCKNSNVFLRYYHVFSEGELEKLCECVKEVNVIKSYYDQGNWCVILKKNLVV